MVVNIVRLFQKNAILHISHYSLVDNQITNFTFKRIEIRWMTDLIDKFKQKIL